MLDLIYKGGIIINVRRTITKNPLLTYWFNKETKGGVHNIPKLLEK